MEPNRHFANASERAESQSVDVSNLNLQQLRALLHEHEDMSRKSLDYALSKKQSAERHHDIAREREAEAQAYLTRYEAAEVVVEALRKTIVDRSKLVLERRYEPSPVRALEKRQRVSTQNTSVTVRADQHEAFYEVGSRGGKAEGREPPDGPADEDDTGQSQCFDHRDHVVGETLHVVPLQGL